MSGGCLVRSGSMGNRPRTQGRVDGQQIAPAVKYQEGDMLGISTASWKKEREDPWSPICLRMRNTTENERRGEVQGAQRVFGGRTKSC